MPRSVVSEYKTKTVDDGLECRLKYKRDHELEYGLDLGLDIKFHFVSGKSTHVKSNVALHDNN